MVLNLLFVSWKKMLISWNLWLRVWLKSTLNVKKPSGHLGLLVPLLTFVMSGKSMHVKSMNLFLRFTQLYIRWLMRSTSSIWHYSKPAFSPTRITLIITMIKCSWKSKGLSLRFYRHHTICIVINIDCPWWLFPFLLTINTHIS